MDSSEIALAPAPVIHALFHRLAWRRLINWVPPIRSPGCLGESFEGFSPTLVSIHKHLLSAYEVQAKICGCCFSVPPSPFPSIFAWKVLFEPLLRVWQMQGRYNDKLQTVTAKEELTVSGGGAGEAGINKDEAAWLGGGIRAQSGPPGCDFRLWPSLALWSCDRTCHFLELFPYV